MGNAKRQEDMLEYLGEHKFASVAELSSHVYTSEATVRREIKVLESMGAVKSVYGGVVLTEYEKEPVPLYLRDKENSAGKERIAERAARLIKENTTVILDSSSTVRRMCKHIKGIHGLTVITNNLRVCEELKDSDVRVVCTGGTLIKERECFVGHFAESFIRQVKADMLFFSSQGVSDNGDITDSSENEIALRRVMLDSAREAYFLFDPSKRGREFPFVLTNLSEVTDSVTDD